MGAWSKYVLGWINPQVLPYGGEAQAVVLGQASRVPTGTEAAVKVELPAKTATFGEPHSGDLAWWTSNDQGDADVRLTRSVDVPTGTDVRFWMWNSYTIEELWDYGFVEVSTDDGTSWSPARGVRRGRATWSRPTRTRTATSRPTSAGSRTASPATAAATATTTST